MQRQNKGEFLRGAGASPRSNAPTEDDPVKKCPPLSAERRRSGGLAHPLPLPHPHGNSILPPYPPSSAATTAPSPDDAGSAQHSDSDSESNFRDAVPANGCQPGAVPKRTEFVESVLAAYCTITDAPAPPGLSDLKLAAAWYDAGIPLPIVEHAFRRVYLNRAAGSTDRPVRSLAYFAGEVEQCRKEPPDPKYRDYVQERFEEIARP
jgi:hypothetical protein